MPCVWPYGFVHSSIHVCGTSRKVHYPLFYSHMVRYSFILALKNDLLEIWEYLSYMGWWLWARKRVLAAVSLLKYAYIIAHFRWQSIGQEIRFFFLMRQEIRFRYGHRYM